MNINIAEILTVLGSVVGALGGWQVIKYLLNLQVNKRKEEIEVKKTELGTLREQYDWLQNKYEKLSSELNSLYKEFRALEKKNLDLLKKNNELELALQLAKYNECKRPDEECLKRIPKRERCRLVKLLNGMYDEDPNGNPTLVDDEDIEEQIRQYNEQKTTEEKDGK